MGAVCAADASSNVVEDIAASSSNPLPTLLSSDCSKALDALKKEASFEKPFWVEVGDGYTGLVLDISDSTRAVVAVIEDGTIQDYNASASPLKTVESMDYLIQVNHVSGDPERMEVELRTPGKKRLLIAKPMTITITVGLPLGMGVSHQHGSISLLVRDIIDGSVANWNHNNIDKLIKEGDRIVEINGRKGFGSQLDEALRNASGDCRLVFARPFPWRPSLTKFFPASHQFSNMPILE